MGKATRLFDCIEAQAKEPRTDLLNAKVDGIWKSYSTSEVHNMIHQLSQALLDMGISARDGTTEGRDKIGLISTGRPEWLIVDLAVQLTGAILVPLYPNTSNKEIEQILVEAEVKYVFVGTNELCNKVKEASVNIPSLKDIFTFDQVEGCTHWTKLLNSLKEGYQERSYEISNKITEDDVATIIYTSGTYRQTQRRGAYPQKYSK